MILEARNAAKSSSKTYALKSRFTSFRYLLKGFVLYYLIERNTVERISALMNNVAKLLLGI